MFYHVYFMNKKVLIPLIVAVVLLVAGVAYLAVSLSSQRQANKEM